MRGQSIQYVSSQSLSSLIIIIIMYIYHALINALSAHMTHINLNTIFYVYTRGACTVLPKQFTTNFISNIGESLWFNQLASILIIIYV